MVDDEQSGLDAAVQELGDLSADPLLRRVHAGDERRLAALRLADGQPTVQLGHPLGRDQPQLQVIQVDRLG